MSSVTATRWPTSVSVVVPTFNERQNIEPLVRCLLAELDHVGFRFEILVVDDNSPDGTADIVRQAFQQRPEVKVFVRTEDRGLARAILHGIHAAQYDAVVVMDSDFNHDPRMVPLLVRMLADFDLAIGSRYVLGGGMDETWRYWMSFAYNFLLRLYVGTQIQDNLSGFFATHRKLLAPLATPEVFDGYGEYFIRLLGMAQRQKLTVVEVPAYYWVRRFGATKSRFWQMAWIYTRAAIRLRMGGPPLPGRGATPYVPPGAASGSARRPLIDEPPEHSEDA